MVIIKDSISIYSTIGALVGGRGGQIMQKCHESISDSGAVKPFYKT